MFPLNLYARVRFCYVHFARETAGAARTRSSLRPLFSEGGKLRKPRASQAAGMRTHILAMSEIESEHAAIESPREANE